MSKYHIAGMNEADAKRLIKAWYDMADVGQKHRGENWYPAAREEIRQMSETYDVSYHAAAAVAAVISPGVKWQTNLKDLRHLLACYVDDELEKASISSYGANLKKAKIILEDRDYSQVRGPKVTAFFKNLDGYEDVVTVDRWVLRSLGIYKEPGIKVKNRVAALFQEVAHDLGIYPSTLQATIWVVIKDLQEEKETA